jgi:hypothetical protein
LVALPAPQSVVEHARLQLRTAATAVSVARAWKGIDQKQLTKEQLSELTTEKDKRKIELK